MSAVDQNLKGILERVSVSDIPINLKTQITTRIDQLLNLKNSPTFLPEYDRMTKYVEWILALPWNTRTEDNLDINKAKEILDKNHHGLSEIKDRILEYLSVMKLKRDRNEGAEVYRAPILCFVGLAGTGKTTIAISIAEAMGRRFARIPFGGMGDALELRGQSRMHSESEPGKVIKALRSTGSKNCVILLDEIDRVTEQGRSSIMGVLVELLDPTQNKEYVDHYIDYPFDLSEVLFVATSNNTQTISTAVMDRLEPISMPSYSDNDKITIAKNYMMPRIRRNMGIDEQMLVINDDVWPLLVRPFGFDAGMRTLERTLQGVARKVARMLVEGSVTNVTLTRENFKEFIS
ncbi:MAG: AAA family ATPase [Patescibacteria group bacterium]|nr:AAA family ATPase [Patescibacteria group bacterium]